MKHLIYLFLCFPMVLSAQQVFSFENSNLDDWIQSPHSRWQITSQGAISGESSLHHSYDNPESGVDCIGYELGQADMSAELCWTFRIRHAYNPSTANNWQFYVLCDDPALDRQNVSASLVFGVNYNCSDDLLKVWQQVGGELLEILASDYNYQDSIGVSESQVFSLKRDPGGEWVILVQSDDSGVWREIGRGSEKKHLTGTFMGFRYAYSSAQDRKLWVDDINVNGHFFDDTLAPTVQGLTTEGMDVLEIKFQESVLLNDSSDFEWEGLKADSVFLQGSHLLLYFQRSFPNRIIQELSIKNISDLSANVLLDTTLEFYLDMAEFGDIVINEILQDPLPVVYLPAFEYVEIYNRYEKPVCMDGWKIVVNGKAFRIDSFQLQSRDYGVLTSVEGAKYFREGEVLGLFTSSTLLTNGGALISLYDQYGRMIHTMKYEALDRYDPLKSEGGWSLEQRDPNNLCAAFGNWAISEYWKGGTPGFENSVQEEVLDFEAPEFLYLGIEDSSSLSIYFDENVLNEEEEMLVSLNQQLLDADYMKPYASQSYSFIIPEGLIADEQYSMKIEGVSDCAGNIQEKLEYTFELAELPDVGSMILNEIMYDPNVGGVEYIELKNVSSRVLDLSDLRIGLSEMYAKDITILELSNHSHLILPESILVFCSKARILSELWSISDQSKIVEITDWKSLPDNRAWLYILNKSGDIIDNIEYSDDLHNDIVENRNGVSLERIVEVGMMGDPTNWSSASASVNYGSPGEENSQSVRYDEVINLKISPKVFSPDNDGYEDFLQIDIPSEYQEGVLDIIVSSLSGIMIREIVRNGVVGYSDLYIWNGEDNEGLLAQPGLYVIQIRIVKDGKLISKEQVCGLRYR